ncbi:Gluconate 5-dehydrogenase [Sodalis glossinidius str. 'morsitans']|uniref:Gluconate 5-dehydrogenase n=1 Tax=Sodalis glossinidius (strain morsitans) TaxID=343509 RepID=Q2NS27_SODGM|nr:putative gluconate 5-dehydrogenase [Sodalis glossinidius str. 'morsitans']CRL45956.1 Gluconate 5-dehydrogenase [Sodalis glossinidius str. 'morsitans']
MQNLFDLTGKRALITGGSQGIGYLLAGGLGRHGAGIIVSATTTENAERAAEQLRAEGLDEQGVSFDITQGAKVSRTIEQLEQQQGPIDILINNAGIQRRHPLLTFPEADWDEIINVNQKEVFLTSQQVAKRMVTRRRGKIINIGSMQSELARPNITPYAAAKGAVKMLTRGMCAELAPYNIQVNGIALGYFKTEMTTTLSIGSFISARTPGAGAILRN